MKAHSPKRDCSMARSPSNVMEAAQEAAVAASEREEEEEDERKKEEMR